LQETRLKLYEDLEKCVIEMMPVVSSLCFHAADAKNKSGYHVNLRCDCGVKQVGTIRMSSKRPTTGDCLRELGRVIQQDHVPPASLQRKNCKMLKKMLLMCPQNVPLMRQVPGAHSA
jgi:hypothetical protein